MITATFDSQLVGDSPAIAELRVEIERTARSEAKVLVTGESGAGKELVARAVHAHSVRAARPFVAVNCAGLPETLLESELFGHVKGSFTGAYRDKQGKLEMADGGTLFLDEVGEMTLRMQGLLLRFLETGELQKVGADRVRATVSIRVIAATNKNLRDLIGQQAVPRGPLLPPQRDPPGGAAAARAAQRHPVAGREVPVAQHLHRPLRAARRLAGDDGRALQVLVAGQRPRAAEPGRAAGGDLPARDRAARGSAAGDPAAAVWHLQAAARAAPHRVGRALPALVESGESFWTAVYPLYMNREITRGNLRDLVKKGLQEARGNYRIVVRLFNMDPGDYKRFLNFLRTHECQVSFKEFR